MEFDDVILGRRSTHGYKPDPVPPASIQHCIGRFAQPLMRVDKLRDAETCANLLQKHISRRLDEIMEATHKRIAQIYTERASGMRS